MRRTFLILGLLVAAVLALLWLTGGYAVLQAWVFQAQREAQSTLAAAVRAIKTGQPGALAGLLTICFSYGVLHAVGPGHGKMLIGGYGMGRRVPVVALSSIALTASLVQAAVAVAVVYAGVAVLGWTRKQMEGVAENIMAPAGMIAIAGVGVWLMWRGYRGARRVWASQQTADSGQAMDGQVHAGKGQPGKGHADHGDADHDHAGHDHAGHDHTLHHHDPAPTPHVHDEHCGHAHGPSLEEVSKLTGWRDTAALIAGIAMRPCSGALFLLILTWQLGIGLAGIAGTFAMGIGTALVTIGVALLAVWAREGALASLPLDRAARMLPLFEMAAGALVAVIALSLLTQSL